ncbi:FAD/NAD(P)-binding protein [Corynebacterium sp.]|uniref:FAD/NAD(P)-binding protein n=1 Tax=Corynebacterium sp. TaxID=1720 RepID=UPI003B3BAC7A
MSTIAVIGGGPRGISVLERLAALISTNDRSGDVPAPPVTVHIVDDVAVGTGRIWRTDQTRTLCMNTLADAVTLFTEPGSSVRGPVLEGPTMYEWIRLLRGEELGTGAATGAADPSGAKTALFRAHPCAVPEEFAAEIAGSRPESHPSRALYGHYLQWVFDTIVARLPEGLVLHTHTTRATDIHATDDGRTDRITLADGTVIEADATVLALGWTDTEPDALETFTAQSVEHYPELVWVRPGNPADQGVDALPAGEDVLVRGLGMGLFDLMAMVTVDRGGRFVPDDDARSGLRYEPSGREPRLVVSSHHGYPYQPKPVYRALPPAATMPRFRAELAALPSDAPAGSVDFGERLWPALLRDAHEAYYRVLLRTGADGADAADPAVLDDIVAVIDAADDPWHLHDDPALIALVPDATNRFDIPGFADPVATYLRHRESQGLTAPSIDELTGHIGDRLTRDLHEATLGTESAVKAGLQVIGSARKPAQVADQPGRFTLESRRGAYAALRRVGQMVGSGPPAFRTAELLCLVDAGYVRFLGGHPTVVIDPEAPAFLMASESTGDRNVASTALVDAWLHKPSARDSADPVTTALVRDARLRPFVFSSAETSAEVVSKAPEVDLTTSRLVHVDGSVDPRVHMLGIPLQEVRADMTISPMPRTDPLMLQETDGAAVSVLSVLAAVSRPPVAAWER